MLKISKWLLPIAFTGLVGIVAGQEKKPGVGTAQELAKKIEFAEYRMDNGMHVILHQDKSTPIVAVSIMYHVGSKNESSDRTGFAHFFEHLMFEGSDNIKRGEYFKMVQNAGGIVNANTTWDRTYFYEVLPSNQLELGLWLESERLLHLKMDSVGVETQRKVVKEERSARYDNQPYGSLIEQTFAHAYTVHPYRWTPIGSTQYIDKAKLEEFVDFHNTFYVPENATLSIAGDIDFDTAKELIKKYFGDIPKGKKPIVRPKVVEPAQTKEVRDIIYDNIQLPAVVQAYHIPPQGTEDSYAIEMLTKLLSEGESSRLTKSIVDKQQKAMYVGSFPIAMEDPGIFLAFGIANSGVTPEDLEKSIDAEVDRVKNELIPEEEFQKLRNQTESEFVSKNSTVAGIAESLANYHVYLGDANLINTEIGRYMIVTKEDLQRVAKKYLTKENRVVLYYLPKSQKK